MVTIYRAQGLRVVIFTDDHEPAHVHVFGDGHAKINLIGRDGGPELVWAEGMKRNEVRRAMQIVTEEQVAFLARWREIHG
jgi:NCAIR mutase (PurE)-related protein